MARLKAPAYLTAATRRWWEQTAERFGVEQPHLKLLTLAATAWDEHEKARKILARDGFTFEDRWGLPRSRPEIAIARDGRATFARLMKQLNLADEPGPDLSYKEPTE